MLAKLPLWVFCSAKNSSTKVTLVFWENGIFGKGLYLGGKGVCVQVAVCNYMYGVECTVFYLIPA